MNSRSRFPTFPRLLLITACFLYQPLGDTEKLTADGPLREPPIAHDDRFFEEPVRLQTSNNVSFIDSADKMVIQLPYDLADDFAEGLAAVATGDKVGYIDKNGRVVIPLRYD